MLCEPSATGVSYLTRLLKIFQLYRYFALKLERKYLCRSVLLSVMNNFAICKAKPIWNICGILYQNFMLIFLYDFIPMFLMRFSIFLYNFYPNIWPKIKWQFRPGGLNENCQATPGAVSKARNQILIRFFQLPLLLQSMWNCKIYLSEIVNAFLQISKGICMKEVLVCT